MIVNNIVILVMMFICLFETDLMHHLPLYAIVALLFFAVFILNRKAVESIFYKVLPARIASHFVSLSTAKLCAVIGGLAVFVLIDLLTRGIIVYALLLAGFVFAIYKNKNRLMYIFMVLMPLSLVFRHGMVWAAVAFLILAVAVIIKIAGQQMFSLALRHLIYCLVRRQDFGSACLRRRCRHLYAALYSADRYGISLLNGHIKSGRDTAFYR